ncbi:MAG TPA: TetR/AcrR family transcriptional regulator [Deltaproteobacteria bacterium]|nr:TetR/AcrR family transcriptional regulator [Deltaproteobacteria bacterium]HPR53892.1 TetR/AcrR family transcriptional regulator [Deltaproteobacteria bacterium]HXK46692.1 TetR/AcrR family transcriptional regulator [Deltaproteobacteria bacterium]
MEDDLKFEAFEELVCLSMENLSRDLFQGNRKSIKIKKEGIAVKNLVKILNAALKLSNQKGFAAMSLRDLSREAGLSMGALYTYFTSKEELLHMIQRQSAVVMQVLIDQIEGIDNPRAKLKTAIRAHLFLSEILREWFYFSYMEAKNLAKEEQKKAIESELFTEKIFIDILKQGQKTGDFREFNTELVGGVIKAMLQEWYLKRWKYTMRKVSVENYADFLVELAESYLLSPQP